MASIREYELVLMKNAVVQLTTLNLRVGQSLLANMLLPSFCLQNADSGIECYVHPDRILHSTFNRVVLSKTSLLLPSTIDILLKRFAVAFE